MSDWLRDPINEAVVVPFLLGLLLTLGLRHFGGRLNGPRLAPASIAAGLALATAWLAGVGPMPPVQTTDKLFWVVLIAVLVPWACGWLASGEVTARAWRALYPLLAVLWLGETLIANALSGRLVIELAGLVIGSWILFWSIGRADSPDPGAGDVGEALRAPVHLLILGVSGGVIFFQGGGLVIAQLSGALAALAGGYLLVSYADQARGEAMARMSVHATAAAGAWLALVYLGVLLGEDVPRGPLLLLLVGPLLHPLARRLAFGSGAVRRMVSPLAYGAVSAMPAAGALLWVLLAGGDSAYR